MDKKMLRDLVDYVYRNLGPKATVILSDRLKDLGYKFSTQGGLSISIDAMITPTGHFLACAIACVTGARGRSRLGA